MDAAAQSNLGAARTCSSLGSLVRQVHGPEAAQELAAEATGLFGDRPPLLELGGICRDQLGDPLGAEAWFRRSMEAGGDSSSLYYHLALALTHQERPAEARKLLIEALRRDPGSVRARQLLTEIDSQVPGGGQR